MSELEEIEQNSQQPDDQQPDDQESSSPDQPHSRSHSTPASRSPSLHSAENQSDRGCPSPDAQQRNRKLRAAAAEMQARIDALEFQLTSEQGKAFRATQDCDRLECELEILRSVKGDRMSISGRLATMADTLAGTHKELIGAMQQRNALKSLLKNIIQAVSDLTSAAESSRYIPYAS